MRKYDVVLCLSAVFTLAASCAFGQAFEKLRTTNTYVEFQAQAAAPLLVRLGTSGQSSWQNNMPERLIESAEVNGKTAKVSWKFNPGASRTGVRSISFVYDSVSPRLRATWEWQARAAFGPIEHTVHIQNLESKEIWIPMLNSLEYNFRTDHTVPLLHVYVEKGADKPSEVGTHEEALPVGYQWNGTSSTYAHPAKGEAREIIPWFAVQNTQSLQSGWYVGIEFSGRTQLTLQRDSMSVHGVIGLNPNSGAFRTRLKPQETFDSPTVFLGAFTGDVDALGNTLRPWVRQVLTNARAWQNPKYPLLVNNSWGSGMQVDEALAHRMVGDSAELGLEMFHIDAGWFRGVGDWYPNPNKFPYGLAAIADDAHRHGLKFGIWADWTQAALGTEPGALNVHDSKVRDWMVTDLPPDWKPEEFKGQTIDIGDPAAHAYAQHEVNRLVEDYHLDMLEHDGYLVAQGCVRANHPHAPPDRSHMSIVKDSGAYFAESSNSTDVSYHAVRAYYDIYSKLRQQYPDVLLEICNDGGRMVDFGTAAHGDYFSITDAYDPLSNRRAFYDASHLLPAAMLEAYVEKWPTPKIENFRYMLRSGMMGWLTIMLDTTAWNAEQHAAAKEEVALYKKQLRPLVRDADLYHVAPRPDGIHWDGTELFDPKRNKGVVYAFRGSDLSDNKHVFKLYGVVPSKRYQLHFQDGTAPDHSVSGRELLESGLSLELPIANSSELIFIDSL